VPTRTVLSTGGRSAGSFLPRRARVAEGAENLCDVLVFVEESCSAVSALDAETVEVDHVAGRRSERRGLAESLVWPMQF
jgi:hypothetical protein